MAPIFAEPGLTPLLRSPVIDPATMQVNPCPICGSFNVRWRRRQWYDGIFTLLAYLVNTFWLVVMPSRRPTAHVESRVAEEVLEDRVGPKTARYFWRCPDWRNSGSIFDEPPPDLALRLPPQP